MELQTDTDDAARVMLTVNSTMCEMYNLTCTYGTTSGRATLSITGNHTIATYQNVIVIAKELIASYSIFSGFVGVAAGTI